MTVAVYDWKKLTKFCQSAFVGEGVPERHAKLVAESLVQANLRGVDSHGVVRMGIYLDRIKAGRMNAHAEPSIVQSHGSIALVDAHNNFGVVGGMKALDTALDKAAAHGAAIVGVKRSNHFGTGAFYALQAIDRDFILLVMSNASQTMPPTGGIRPFIGTNPLAVGIPAGQEQPFLLDMATSVVARGKIIVAAQKGEPIPEGWGIDQYGNPTTNAQAALEGSVLPVGGAKGYAISMFIDILSGVLTGAGYGKFVNNMYENWDEDQNVGHFFIAVDIGRFLPIDQFKARMDDYIRTIKAEPKAPGVDEIYVPGELEFRLTEHRQKNGIELPPALAAELTEIGARYGIKLEDALAMNEEQQEGADCECTAQ